MVPVAIEDVNTKPLVSDMTEDGVTTGSGRYESVSFSSTTTQQHKGKKNEYKFWNVSFYRTYH